MMRPTNYEDDDEAPSELFQGIATYSGGLCQRVCECGRLYFVDGPEKGDYDSGELEDLTARHAVDSRVCRRWESIPTAHLAGKEYVSDCPCNRLRRYEDFIWENREMIAEYLIKRTAQRQEAAERDAAKMAGLSEVTGE